MPITVGYSYLAHVPVTLIVITLHLDISALMGYSGAVFQKFFGTGTGMAVSLLSLALWVVLPLLGLIAVAGRKDY